MREPTDQEKKDFKYVVSLNINVTRTDNKMLSDDENAMVQRMRIAAESSIAMVMSESGNKNSKHLGTETRIY